MFARIFSLFGMLPSLPAPSGEQDQPEMEGSLSASFVSGAKATATPEEDQQEQQDRRAQIAQRDLVWPGKTESIQIQNPYPENGRFEMTITDLPAPLYVRRPPVGGQWQSEGGVLLKSGEEATFEIVFVPAASEQAKSPVSFNVVLTHFDPRRTGDPGEIMGEMPLRWVPPPSASDFRLSLTPSLVITRPWRRAALVQAQIQNRSYLPPVVELQIERAPTKEALTKEPEPVGSLSRTLDIRREGLWHCLLPAFAERASYFVGARGLARVGAGTELALPAPKPVLVRYVPWLRMGRDWALLVGALLLLGWLVWGIPVQKRAEVAVALNFAGNSAAQVPYGGTLQSLQPQMVLLNPDGSDDKSETPINQVAGNHNGNIVFEAPPRWYGFRWAFGKNIGWNGWSRAPQKYRLQLTPPAPGGPFDRYNFASFVQGGDAIGSYSIAEAPDLLGKLEAKSEFPVYRSDSALLRVTVGDWGGLTPKNIKDIQELTFTLSLSGKPALPPQTMPVDRDRTGAILPITLDLTDSVPAGPPQHLQILATALGRVNALPTQLDISRGKDPFPVRLTFPTTIPAISAGDVQAEKAKADNAKKAAAAKQEKEKKDAEKKAAADKTKKQAQTQKAAGATKTATPSKIITFHPTTPAMTDRSRYMPPNGYLALLTDDLDAAKKQIGNASDGFSQAMLAYIDAKLPQGNKDAATSLINAQINSPDPQTKAMALVAKGTLNPAEAETDFRAALVAKPGFTLAHVALAQVLKNTSADNAISEMDSVVKSATGKEKAAACYQRAKIYLATGSPDDAKGDMADALRYDPNLAASPEVKAFNAKLQ